MFNKQVAKCAASMSWRFFILLSFMAMLSQSFLSMQSESLLIPLLLFMSLFFSMYFTLIWMSITNTKKAEREQSTL